MPHPYRIPGSSDGDVIFAVCFALVPVIAVVVVANFGVWAVEWIGGRR